MKRRQGLFLENEPSLSFGGRRCDAAKTARMRALLDMTIVPIAVTSLVALLGFKKIPDRF